MARVRISRVLLANEKRLRKKINRELKKLANTVADRIESQDQKTLQEDLFVDIDLAFTAIVGDLVNHGDKVLRHGQRVIKNKLKLDISFELLDQGAVRYLERVQDLHLSNRDGSITLSTKEKISSILTEGVQEGQSYTEIAKKIREQTKAGIFSPARSRLIAVRELGHAYEYGRRQPINEMTKRGMRFQKIWDTVGDSKVTPECRHNESQGWILYNQSWPSGDQIAPRNSNPRCRCTTNYRKQAI